MLRGEVFPLPLRINCESGAFSGDLADDIFFVLLFQIELLADAFPTKLQDGTAFSGEFLSPAAEFYRYFGVPMIFSGCAEKSCGYQLENGHLRRWETRKITFGHCLRRDNGVMIADLAAVENRSWVDRLASQAPVILNFSVTALSRSGSISRISSVR